MDITEEHWLVGVKIVLSPFFNERPEGEAISLLVLHNISLPPNQYGGDSIEKFFTGKLNPDDHPFFKVIHNMQVSAHCLIKRCGEIVQFVPFNKRAWHAGKSMFAGRENCNDFSIGIELEGTDLDSYTENQYQVLAKLTRSLQIHYPHISSERITGHQYIAPIRKSDPGLVFDWRKYKSYCITN
ncbi:1,6-anhydro-N-acetylmuramyl-L-alanine amidase AmpD [Vibrio hannami]|uniref:1,6-anhydro-N-acetylmuramyl-L-alanine amidase AmpD n=1 Tax=Vibrio hannami TaxID=2717094 RepID=UPI00240F1649|nr:1,6-anhydro-N-acetylmuramyl-L-alanine amidase AmpD [Vibrio hannami]MDG3088977.1 1,6-anhydro-N-acetylmuramyl-L-alanine amidase AmpD [Vibrio hannami]